jgi:hypothetical protein
VDPRTIRDFVNRRWDWVEREKFRVLADRYRQEGPRMGLEVLAELRQRLNNVGRAPYTVESLAEDLSAHVLLARKLARVRDGLSRR